MQFERTNRFSLLSKKYTVLLQTTEQLKKKKKKNKEIALAPFLLIFQDVGPFLASIKSTLLFILWSQSPVTLSDSLSAQNSSPLYIVVWRKDARNTMFRRPGRICLRDTTRGTSDETENVCLTDRISFSPPFFKFSLGLFFFVNRYYRYFSTYLLPSERVTKSIKIH